MTTLPKSLLVIDDNSHARTIISTIARAAGVETIVPAANGAEAMQALRTHAFECATLDLNMAPIDGFTLLGIIRSGTPGVDRMLPIIVVTGHTNTWHVQAARDAGADEVLSKPLTAAGLVSRLDAVMRFRRPFIAAPEFVGPDRRRRSDRARALEGRRFNDEQKFEIE